MSFTCCEYFCCGSNGLSMSTVNANPGVCQSSCGGSGCGGASSLSQTLNAVGRWGTIFTATLQGKPVVAGTTKIGAKGTTSVSGGMNATQLIFLLIVVGIAIFLFRK